MTSTTAAGATTTQGADAPPPLARATSAMARLSGWGPLIAGCAVYVPFAAVLFASSAPFAVPRVEAACGQAPPDVRFTTSAADVIGFLDACGAAGREAYRSMQLADLLYPAVFGLFMAVCLAFVALRLAPARPALLLLPALPLLGSAFDYLENVFAWLALATYPSPAATNALMGLASAAKNVTFWTAGAVLLGGLGLLLVTGLRRARRPDVTGAGAAVTRAGRS